MFFGMSPIFFKDTSYQPKVIEQAMLMMIEKHEILRAGFDIYGFDEPLKVIFKSIHPDIVQYDITSKSKEEQVLFINDILNRERKNPFDVSEVGILWRLRIFRMYENNILFIWMNHHAIFDGWSFASFITELNNTYLNLRKDAAYRLTKLESSYRDFVIEELEEKENPETRQFWKNELKDYKRLVFPPINKENTIVKYVQFERYPEKNTYNRLLEALNMYNSSVKNICFAAYLMMLREFSGLDDLCAGLVINNRPNCKDSSKILGCFVNEVPFRFKVTQNQTWREYIRSIDLKLIEIKKFDKLPLADIVRTIGEKTQNQNPLFDTVFNIQNFHVYDQMSEGLEDSDLYDELKQHISGEGVINTLLTLSIRIGAGFNIEIGYSNRNFNNDIIEMLYETYIHILNRMMDGPGEKIEYGKLLQINKIDGLNEADLSVDEVNFNF
jgi:surfactin family lipopeptide synthetase A